MNDAPGDSCIGVGDVGTAGAACERKFGMSEMGEMTRNTHNNEGHVYSY